jgi:hypothetical protein
LNYCPNCGKRVDSVEDRFCGGCGFVLNNPSDSKDEGDLGETESQETVQKLKPNVYKLGVQLENTVASIFENMGYTVEKRQKPETKTDSTAEIDLIVTRDNRRKAVECKNYDESSTIGVSLVRLFKGKLDDIGIASGLFVTSAKFSADAEQFALSSGIELWDGEKLKEKVYSHFLGRGLSSRSLVNDLVLPLKLDYESASRINFKNIHAIKLADSVLTYHPYTLVKYRLQGIRYDPSGKKHVLSNEGTYIVDAVDGEIINREGAKAHFFDPKTKKNEVFEDDIVTEDLMTMTPVTENVNKVSEYTVSVAQCTVNEEDATRLVKDHVIAENTRDVSYITKVRNERHTLTVVPKAKEISIRGVKVVYVPKWMFDYEVGQRNFERRLIASSGRLVYDEMEKCEDCRFLKGQASLVCQYCGKLLCEKHGNFENDIWVCKEHLSEGEQKRLKERGIFGKMRKQVGI